MRPLVLAIALAVASALLPTAASANVHARISKSTQTMYVYVHGQLYYSWPVSTGRGRYATPSGNFRAQRLERRWYSTKYSNAPMHNAVFYNRGYAIHSTAEVSKLGRPASHGCVRLSPGNAAQFFQLVRSYGPSQTRITISN
jgi:lipoprotein-anchoring transpeptidase ErfK/SrfK